MRKISAKILIIDDDLDVLTAARVVLRQKFEIIDTESNPHRLKTLLQKNAYDAVVLDMNFSAGRTSGNEGLFWLKEILAINPQQRVILITAYGDIQLAVEAMKIGASDFIVKPWSNEKLEATVEAAVKAKSSPKSSGEDRGVRGIEQKNEIIGVSEAIQNVVKMAKKVAATEANVLLLGENGTGKELIAHLIHRDSSRSNEAFMKIDAGAVAPTLFEAELFGHKKGAFTDAKEERVGKIQMADHGTLFLDEIGNLSRDLQIKLLSVLQNRQVTPLGGKPVDVDVRVISATNLDIHRAVDDGSFRQDLLFRINTVEITLPPLRDRREDIPLLTRHFVTLYSSKYKKGKTISNEAVNELASYSWPGNIRQLQHAVERAVIMSDNEELGSRDFLLSEGDAKLQSQSLNLDEMERKAIIAAIQKYNGNMSKVAKELGVGRTTLYRKMARYGLTK